TTSGGSSCPVAAFAARPIAPPVRTVKRRPDASATASSTSRAAPITSAPTPSPGNTPIVSASAGRACSQPGSTLVRASRDDREVNIEGSLLALGKHYKRRLNLSRGYSAGQAENPTGR